MQANLHPTTFEEKSNTLIQRFKAKRQKIDKSKYSKVERRIHFKQMMKNQPREDWNLDDWTKWFDANGDKNHHHAFRHQIDQIFKHEQKHTFSYKAYKLNEQLLNELQSYSHEASRYNHCENVTMCIMYSIYTKVATEMGIPEEDRDTTLWKIGQWKDNNTKTQFKEITYHFITTHFSQVFMPIIEQIGKNLNPKKKKLLFPTEPLNDNEKMAKLLALDLLCHQTELFLSQKITQQQFKEATRQISDDQIARFGYEVALAKAKYITKYTYYPPVKDSDGILADFKDNEIVAMVGDWGSRLRDSYDLIQELVLKRGATVILHLGDVYYAGWPEQLKAISDKIRQLREKVRAKFHKTLRYYTIPGNHEYYTNGGPFYEYLANCNDENVQKFGFFCLRNQSHTLQYIGLDTGRNSSGLLDQVDPFYSGTYIMSQELAWAKRRINEFKGQTILLTHHQLFSPYDAIIGMGTTFGKNDQQMNNLLSEQLFDVLPKVSVWFWGHQHRLAGYINNAYGVATSRLIGNSSFQVHHPNTYDVKFKDFKVLLPLPEFTPGKDQLGWYDHTGALITFPNNQISVRYVNMTSSYDRPSVVSGEFTEIIKAPSPAHVLANTAYKILQSSSLSYSIYKDYVWLHYVPTDFMFQLVNDPTSKAPIPTNTPIYIKTTDGGYLYLSSNYMHVTYLKFNANAFQLTSLTGERLVSTGDSLKLNCLTENIAIGRYNYYWLYYCVAAGGKTENTPIKIYQTSQ